MLSFFSSICQDMEYDMQEMRATYCHDKNVVEKGFQRLNKGLWGFHEYIDAYTCSINKTLYQILS